MKRKLFLVAIAAVSVLVMMSCGQKGSNNNQGDPEEEELDDNVTPMTEDGVIAMLQQAYSDANLVSQPEDGMEANLDLFGMYCSSDFNEKYEQIRNIEANSGERFEAFTDEVGMFVYWEGSTVTIDGIDVAVDGDEASASYTLSNGEDEMITVVKLVYEDGQWRFDNWEQIGLFGIDIKGTMDDFIEENE